MMKFVFLTLFFLTLSVHSADKNTKSKPNSRKPALADEFYIPDRDNPYGSICSKANRVLITTAIIIIHAKENKKGKTKIYYGNSMTLTPSNYTNSIGGSEAEALEEAHTNCTTDGNTFDLCKNSYSNLLKSESVCVVR